MDGASSSGGVAVVAVALLAVFHVCWPFRAGMADRIIGAVAGVLSLACVSTSLEGRWSFRKRYDYEQ